MIEGLPPRVHVRPDEPMARHSPWRVGGPAAFFVTVHEEEQLEAVLTALGRANLSWQAWGAGTRTVVREAGFAGVLVRLGAGFARCAVAGERVVAGAALPVPALLSAAAQAGLAGLEGLARTPGSFGAALKHDDGAWTERVRRVRYVARGRIREGDLAEARQKGVILVGAELELLPAGVPVAEAGLAAGVRGGRGYGPSPNAWWAPPKRGGWRARLERSGLAEVRLRAVLIPKEQPEGFVNLGGGTAADVALLERTVLDRIQRDTGEEPTARVRWIGRQGRG